MPASVKEVDARRIEPVSNCSNRTDVFISTRSVCPRTLKVKGLFKNLPDEIVIDVTDLGISESIRVADIKTDGFEIMNHKSIPVATVVVTRAAKAAMNAPAAPAKK